MLTSTYLHAPGIGPTTERALWAQGALTWDEFLQAGPALRLAARQREALDATLDESRRFLAEGRVDYFARTLPRRAHWRALSHFSRRIGFLDIETNGGMDADAITLIGLYDGCEMHTYLKDRNLAQFAYECQDYDGFVTFFGHGFDLPFLKRRFPVLENVFADRLHVDLCPLLRELGHRGGLKRIEQQMGIARTPETDGLSGYDAVRLWRAFRKGGAGSDEALRLLLAYNREDVINMQFLLEQALPRLREAAGLPERV